MQLCHILQPSAAVCAFPRHTQGVLRSTCQDTRPVLLGNMALITQGSATDTAPVCTRAPHTSHSNNAGTGPTTLQITPQESEQGSQPGRSDSESTVNHAPSKLRSAPKGVHRAHTASKHTPTAPDCPKQHPQAYDIDASAEQQQLPTQLCNLAQPAALATAACTHSKPVRTPESATNLVSGHGVLSTSVGRIRRGYCHLPCCTCNL